MAVIDRMRNGTGRVHNSEQGLKRCVVSQPEAVEDTTSSTEFIAVHYAD
jgi:hypothetical protein